MRRNGIPVPGGGELSNQGKGLAGAGTMKYLWFITGFLTGVVAETLAILYLICLSAVGAIA